MKSLQQLSIGSSVHSDWPVIAQPCGEQLGGEMKVIFGDLTAGPMPDRMRQLVDELEEAFRRGELYAPGSARHAV